MEIVIEKGIPLRKRNGEIDYPFAQMETGDSFLIPGKVIDSLRVSAGRYRQTHPEFNFSLRKENENQYRFWRIEPKSK